MSTKIVISPPSYTGPMDLYKAEAYIADEKHSHGHSHHNGRHNARLRFFALILAFFLFITAMLLLSYIPDVVNAIGWESQETSFGAQVLDLFAKRSDVAPKMTSQNDNVKKYIYIICIGLVVLLIAAILLSAWCCKGVFKNPLCCPCYLCACCGGLACLECISCGCCALAAGEELLE